MSELPPSTTSSESKSMLPPDKFEFLNSIRKRSQKRREKETEVKEEKSSYEILLNKISSANALDQPQPQEEKKTTDYKHLENLIIRKFDDRKSVNKIIQKTMKLQKNIDEKLTGLNSEEGFTGDALRLCIMQRISVFQKQRACNFNKREKERGEVHRRPLKLNYQYSLNNKRKTRTFDLYDEAELDFPDINNLLKK